MTKLGLKEVRKPAPRKKEPNLVDRYVGSRIRIRRNMLGMSQGKLGDALGLTFQQVQKYEKGANRVGASRLQQIGNVLGAPPAWFFEGAPSEGAGKSTTIEDDYTAFMSEKLAVPLIRGFIKLSPNARRAIVSFVTALAGEPEPADERA